MNTENSEKNRSSSYKYSVLEFRFGPNTGTRSSSLDHNASLHQHVSNLEQWLCPRKAILLLYLQFLILGLIPSTTMQPQPPRLGFPGQLSSLYIYPSNCWARCDFISEVGRGEKLFHGLLVARAERRRPHEDTKTLRGWRISAPVIGFIWR